ncbi:MAG: glutamate synthase [Planctomycetes bacterium]|nr:glutamate synthase [Planctomycetota bacterium]
MRALEEFERKDAIFDLPRKKFWQPDPALDLSCTFRGEPAATPAGPAAGPQSQLIQNIVLSYLAGGRVVELKTVQVDDRLEIPRPCIDARHVGYNVEWSQELRVEDALEEYVAAWMFLRILRETGAIEETPGSEQVLFDMSVGYDLAGIRTRKVTDFVRTMLDASEVIDRLRGRLRGPLARFADLDYEPRVAAGITLSTFHGCPADEIEAICAYLLEDLGVHTLIKLNPTLLGYEAVEDLVRSQLGYEHVRLDKGAFEHDLAWEEMEGIVGRLEGKAQAKGLTLGVKFTNTLVVENTDTFFPDDKMMYLSGAPLHVISTTLAARFREQFADRYAISFSAGVDRKNFSELVAGDLAPITTCTDLLRAGGYGRMTGYLRELEGRMRKLGVSNRGDYVLAARGQGAALAGDVLGEELGALVKAHLEGEGPKDVRALLAEHGASERYGELVTVAGSKNLSAYAGEVAQDPRYAFPKNSKAPRKIGSDLTLFDCISCDKCIPVCPNDANFFVTTRPVNQAWERVVVEGPGKVAISDADEPYTVEQKHQIANYADFCNECGNCDVFCPESGGPYIVKPRFFGNEGSYREAPNHDGFFLEHVPPGGARLRGRIEGVEHTLVRIPGAPDRFEDDGVAVELDVETGKVLGARPFFRAKPGHELLTWRYLAMRTLLEGLLEAGATNPVGAAHAASDPRGPLSEVS